MEIGHRTLCVKRWCHPVHSLGLEKNDDADADDDDSNDGEADEASTRDLHQAIHLPSKQTGNNQNYKTATRSKSILYSTDRNPVLDKHRVYVCVHVRVCV